MIYQINFRSLFIAVIAICVSASLSSAGLIHRFSFKDGAKDSVSNVEGKLKGGATVADGKLVLKNDGTTAETLQHLEFAASILPKGKTASFVFWFTAKDIGPYARLLNIGGHEGGEGRAFLYITPHTADGQSRAAITATDVGGRIPLDAAPLDDGKPHMFAVVIDDTKMHVFIDGKEAGTAVDLGENTLDKLITTDNWIGKSSFDADPGLTASIDEFRVYDNALKAEEITAIEKAGPDALPAK